MNTIIYTLSDPRDGSVKYIGKTIQKLKYRLTQHLTEVSNNKRKAWIKSLLNEGLLPIIEELDNCEWEESALIERYWISQFKCWGFILKNMTDGGDGTINTHPTEENKQNSSIRMKNKFKNGWPHPMKGKTHTEEAKQKISKAHKGKKLSKEHVEILRNKMIGVKPTEYIINRMIETHGKRVIMLDLDENYIREFYTLIEAARHLGKSSSAKIIDCCKGRRKTAYGFKWVYKVNYFRELAKADEMTNDIYTNLHERMKP